MTEILVSLRHVLCFCHILRLHLAYSTKLDTLSYVDGINSTYTSPKTVCSSLTRSKRLFLS
jgi:hypothetical protein